MNASLHRARGSHANVRRDREPTQKVERCECAVIAFLVQMNKQREFGGRT